MWNSTLGLILIASWITYVGLLGIYRGSGELPLAKFPGPRLAALTTWYQGYFDIWLRGQYFKRINELHATYGPIVRINPHELHISDPEFIECLFTGSGKRRDKDRWVGRSIQTPDSTVTTLKHDHHRARRAAFNSYFSKASVRRFEPVIAESLDNLLQRLDAAAKSGEIVPMNTALKALTSDVITSYCFGESTGFLLRDDYNLPLGEAVAKFFEIAWLMTHVAWLGPLINSLPIKIQVMLMPGLESWFRMKLRWWNQIEEIRSSMSPDEKGVTIFHGILNSELSESEKTTSRLQQEAQLFVQAGQDTTATTLANLTFELLAHPPILKKLKSELAAAFPNPQEHLTSAQLEQLPYLSAVVQEGLRLHPAVPMRMQRISPDEALTYVDPSTQREWVIPAGTSVSMDALSTSMNSSIFPEPRKFIPERWIGNKGLDKYLLSFSKGTRMCAGINLAYAEMYVVLAGIFRKYDLYDSGAKQKTPTIALYDTIRERDVDIDSDFLVSVPKSGIQGVRVVVR